MFHPDTQFLIDHWAALAIESGAADGVPDRARLDPAAFGPRLARTFLLEAGQGDASSIRLAGDWIEALHDRALTGAPWRSVWTIKSRARAENAIDQALDDAKPVVLTAAIGPSMTAVQVSLAPLRGADGTLTRLVGVYAPLATLALGPRDLRLLSAQGLASPFRAGPREPRLAAIDGRRVA